MSTHANESIQKQLQLAVSAHQSGHLDTAEPLYRYVLQQSPSDTMALNMLGALILQRGDFSQGVVLLQESLALEPSQPVALRNLAHAFNELGRHAEALANCDKALAFAPNYLEAVNIRGNALNGLKRHAEAADCYRQIIHQHPDAIEALYNLGTTYKYLQQYPEAIDAFKEVLRLAPDLPEAHNNLGICYQNTNCCREAISCYDQALSRSPDYVLAHWNKALCLLALGEIEEGWLSYEWGWKGDAPFRGQPRRYPQPLWLGSEPISGKTLLLHAEQGLGDTIQFCRYALKVKKAGAKVTLAVQSSLVPLLQTLDPDITVIELGHPLPLFDLHCPLMSLPLAFKTTLETIPKDTPYLYPPPDYQKKWRNMVSQSTSAKIGIVWSGTPKDENDHNRSIPLELLNPLLEMPLAFHCLQKDLSLRDKEKLATYPNVHIHAAEIGDFADTAALVSAMDLIISVDTSVAHLAAAMDKPVWILLPFAPDFRWLLERRDSPWYPSALLYRQPSIGNWPAVIKQVCEKLQELTQG